MREMETLEERLWLYEQVQPMLHKQAPNLFSSLPLDLRATWLRILT